MKTAMKKAQATRGVSSPARVKITGTPPRGVPKGAGTIVPSAVNRVTDRPITAEDAQKLTFAQVLDHVATLKNLY